MSKPEMKVACYMRVGGVESASERQESATQLERAERVTEQLGIAGLRMGRPGELGGGSRNSGGEGMTLDDRDKAILAVRVAAFGPTEGPRVGDYLDFADGVTRRISYVWPDGVQTSDNGSFYLGKGYMSFSGSLYTSVPTETLTLTEGTREASAWFFHHDHRVAHNAVHVRVVERVWMSSTKAPR